MKLKLSSIILAIMFLLGTAACVNDSDSGCDGGGHDVPVRFILHLGDNTIGRSRAGGVWNPSEPTESGTDFDKQVKLDPKWIHVMVINNDTDGHLVHINLDADNSITYNANEGGYDVKGILSLGDTEWTPGRYRVMVIVNYNDPEGMIKNCATIGDIESLASSMTAQWYNPDGTRDNTSTPYIPMWGMTTAALILDGHHDENLGKVNLLRSVAKVTVNITQEMLDRGYTLQAVSVNASSVNGKLNVLPAGWASAETTIDTGKDNDAAFNPLASPLNANLRYTPAAGTPNEVTFYLPEYAAGTGKVNFTVTLKDRNGDELTYPDAMYIDNTGSGGSYTEKHSVIRNHYHTFSISDIILGKLLYKVECWTAVTSTIGWDVKFNLTSDDSDSKYGYVTNPSYANSQNTSIKNQSSQAVYYFTLSEPKGAVWQAFLLNPDGSDHLKFPNGVTQRFYPEAYDTAADDVFSGLSREKASRSDTPYFRFAPGNENDNNSMAVSTGIAREAPYRIAIDVGSNMWTDFPEQDNKLQSPIKKPATFSLNAIGKMWKDANMVPTVYLVIKVALDGEHFTKELVINPEFKTGVDKDRLFNRKYAGTDTRIEMRQLYIPDYEINMNKMYQGKDQLSNKDDVWWSKPASAL